MQVLYWKAPLGRVFQRMKPFFPSLFRFVLKSFILPFKNTQLIRALAKDRLRSIINPDSGSLGQGILIVDQDTEYRGDDMMAIHRLVPAGQQEV
jgi:hypothetical protein